MFITQAEKEAINALLMAHTTGPRIRHPTTGLGLHRLSSLRINAGTSAEVTHPVSVEIQLIPIVHRRAIITGITHPISISIHLIRVGDPWAVVSRGIARIENPVGIFRVFLPRVVGIYRDTWPWIAGIQRVTLTRINLSIPVPILLPILKTIPICIGVARISLAGILPTVKVGIFNSVRDAVIICIPIEGITLSWIDDAVAVGILYSIRDTIIICIPVVGIGLVWIDKTISILILIFIGDAVTIPISRLRIDSRVRIIYGFGICSRIWEGIRITAWDRAPRFIADLICVEIFTGRDNAPQAAL